MSFLRRQSLPLVALFVALGGTAYAATTFPAHSIGARQLKRNAVTRTKLAANAVTGAKVAPNSLRGADVRESALAEIGSAARSDDAEKLGGATATAYERSVNGSCGAYEGIGSISPDGRNCAGPIDRLSHVLTAGAGGLSWGGSSMNMNVFCHDSGKVEFDIRNVTSADAKLGYFYGKGATVSWGSVLLHQNEQAAFHFAGTRIEGEFVLATTNGVSTLKAHASDNTSVCEVQMTRIFAG